MLQKMRVSGRMDLRTAAAITDKMLVECREFLKTLDPENLCASKNAEAHKSLHHSRLLMGLFFRHKAAQMAQEAAGAAAARAAASKINGAAGLPVLVRQSK